MINSPVLIACIYYYLKTDRLNLYSISAQYPYYFYLKSFIYWWFALSLPYVVVLMGRTDSVLVVLQLTLRTGFAIRIIIGKRMKEIRAQSV